MKVAAAVKDAASFNERMKLLNKYFLNIVAEHKDSLRPVEIVKEILDECDSNNSFNFPVEKFAAEYSISPRTLQRYFENVTGISTKTALQIMRIRKATAHLALSPADFDHSIYEYYDHSHFYKHLKLFLHREALTDMKPHLLLPEKLKAKKYQSI